MSLIVKPSINMYITFYYIKGMAEQMKAFIRLVNQLTITRVGNMFVEKAVVGGVDVEMKKSINKETEWKDNEENPTFHLKVETAV